MIKAGIVGGTGYTGVELLRLLVAHKDVELSVITSRSEAGQEVSSLYPNYAAMWVSGSPSRSWSSWPAAMWYFLPRPMAPR